MCIVTQIFATFKPVVLRKITSKFTAIWYSQLYSVYTLNTGRFHIKCVQCEPKNIYHQQNGQQPPIVLQKVNSHNLSPLCLQYTALPVRLYNCPQSRRERLGGLTFCKTVGVALRSTSDIYSLVSLIVTVKPTYACLYMRNARSCFSRLRLATVSVHSMLIPRATAQVGILIWNAS